MQSCRVMRGLARIVRNHREISKLSQEELALRAHVPVSVLQSLEDGSLDDIELTNLIAIGEALNISPPKLIALAEASEPTGAPTSPHTS